MKKLLRILCIAAFAAMLLCVPAMAYDTSIPGPEVRIYEDVPIGSDYYEAVTWATGRGIVAGTSATEFSPDNEITLGQWCIMLQRLMRPNSDISAWAADFTDIYEAYTSEARVLGWISGDINAGAHSPLSHETLYEIGFAAFYLDYNGVYDWTNASYAGRDAGMRVDLVRDSGKATRGEAVIVLRALCEYVNTVETTESGNAALIDNPYGAMARDYIRRLDDIPEEIIEAFKYLGWTFSIDPGYIADYSDIAGYRVSGLCSYGQKHVYVDDPGAVVHEMGHFLDCATGFTNSTLFEEAEASQAFLRDYSKKNSGEYFADYFAYFIGHRDDPAAMARMQKYTPRTYERFTDLESNNWGLAIDHSAVENLKTAA